MKVIQQIITGYHQSNIYHSLYKAQIILYFLKKKLTMQKINIYEGKSISKLQIDVGYYMFE
jgi:hypothetical protein